MSAPIDRRMVLAAGGAIAVVGSTSAGARRTGEGPAILIFDPNSIEARDAAGAARGCRLIALGGDPVRTWRDAVAGHGGAVSGVTRWSDYLVLRGLAEECGLRLRGEERLAVHAGAMIVRWHMTPRGA